MQSATILDLPYEILASIADYCIIPELSSFNATCTLFRTVSHQRLFHHRALRKSYNTLYSGDTETFGWFQPLVDILRGVVPAEYIEVIGFSRCEYYYTHLAANRAKHEKPPQADLDLVYSAIDDSPWITEYDACGPHANARNINDFKQEIEEGDQDNILAVLVPLLPNLHTILLPESTHPDPHQTSFAISLGSLPQVLARVAKASAHFDDRSPSPLGKLTRIIGSSYHSSILDDWLPYLMCIPSLRYLEVSVEYGFSFRPWPKDLPKSNVQDLIFHGDSIDRVLLDRIARNVVGPCQARQLAQLTDLPDPESFAARWRSCTLKDGGIHELVIVPLPPATISRLRESAAAAWNNASGDG